MTAGGDIGVRRTYFRCETCEENEYPCDERLGIVANLTTRARKLACLFGSSMGFAKAAEHLQDICGIGVSSQSVKRYCYAEGRKVERWRADQEASAHFAKAPGDVEFQTDGTTVNTVEGGWKEVKIAAFVKREAGEPAAAHQWDQRKLPNPSAVSVRISMDKAEEFAATWRGWAASLGIVAFTMITVLGDGAKWIWNQTRIQFPKCAGLLDIYHLLEHVADAIRQVHGESTGVAKAWLDAATRALLLDGWSGICVWIGRWRECYPEQACAPSEELIGYLAPHTQHLDYPKRLANGQTIGSGQIEGACKYVVGRRLKRVGGRWRTAHVARMATLCSTHYVNDWKHYWDAQLALAA